MLEGKRNASKGPKETESEGSENQIRPFLDSSEFAL
jgi:hypothetical protein